MLGFLIVGARPNFMKAAALYKPLSKFFDIRLVHTGQHYDDNMSKIFFNEFNHLDVSFHFTLTQRGHAKQTAEIMDKFDDLCEKKSPDFVIVVGDVNSTLACGLVAKKRGIVLIHIEAGLRSFDQTMPEEVNRLLVDHISDYLFVTEPAAVKNLKAENVQGKHFLVGDVMIDSLINNFLPRLVEIDGSYCVCTIHRQKNVTDKNILKLLLEVLQKINDGCKVIFPIHPNTKKKIFDYNYGSLLKGIDVRDPMSYVDFLSYINGATFVITDSGGLQTECNYLNVPCLILRENTEKIIATTKGTCELVGFDRKKIDENVLKILNCKWRWRFLLSVDDGKASDRIATILKGVL